jgi:farnesyl diphosphate synthase
MTGTLEQCLSAYQARTEKALAACLPVTSTHPTRLHEAMRYASLNGGKRIRPVLSYATADALGMPLEWHDNIACAVEMIHAYSLIHDDLPAMDDDDLRRGKPTCHRVFGEAMAILAGDALQALAFQILAEDTVMPCPAETRVKMIATLSRACGSRGMAGGQAIDLSVVGHQPDIAALEDMHIHKTGMLIRASVVLSAMVKPDIDEQTLSRLDHYAKCIGLAFQIRDDILDIEGDTETLGKPQGSDVSLDKPTYPALIGLEDSRKRARELQQEALDALAGFDQQAESLRRIATYIIERNS